MAPRVKVARLAEPIPVLVTGFGRLLGQIRIGHAVMVTKAFVYVQHQDADGVFEERYHVDHGRREGDEVSGTGWMLSEADLSSVRSGVVRTPTPSYKGRKSKPVEAKLLHREGFHKPMTPGAEQSDAEETVIEVWIVDGEKFVKCYRLLAADKGKRQHQALMPFEALKRILLVFEGVW